MSEVKEQAREKLWFGRVIQTVTIVGFIVGIVASTIYIYTTFFGPQPPPTPYSYGPTTPGNI